MGRVEIPGACGMRTIRARDYGGVGREWGTKILSSSSDIFISLSSSFNSSLSCCGLLKLAILQWKLHINNNGIRFIELKSNHTALPVPISLILSSQRR